MKNKDIILLTGPSGSGKTLGITYLTERLKKDSIFYNEKILSTGNYILDLVKKDDKSGGHHHFHPWNVNFKNGHIHKNNESVLPFTTSDDILNDEAYKSFFFELSKLPQNNGVYIADWTAGVNINTKNSFSQVDRSYKKMRNMLENEKWNNKWIKRVIAILHIKCSYTLRLKLNQKKQNEMDSKTWKLSNISFDYYGKDDFLEIESYLLKCKIKVYNLNNSGGIQYYQNLNNIFTTLNLK